MKEEVDVVPHSFLNQFYFVLVLVKPAQLHSMLLQKEEERRDCATSLYW